MSERPIGDSVDREFRRLVSDVASVPGPTPELDELYSPVLTLEGDQAMNAKTKYGIVGAAAAAVMIIVIGFALLTNGDDNGIQTIDDSGGTSSTVVSPTTAAPEPERADSPPFLADATPLIGEFSMVQPGAYRVNAAGTTFSLTLEQQLWVQPNNAREFVITDNVSAGPGDRDLVFMRSVALVDPTDIFGALTGADDGWPIEDFTLWLDSLPDEIAVSNRQNTFLGDHVAIRADLRLGETDCITGEDFCVTFTADGQGLERYLNEGWVVRVWLADIGEARPLMVIVNVRNESQIAWFDTAEQILSTVAFG